LPGSAGCGLSALLKIGAIRYCSAPEYCRAAAAFDFGRIVMVEAMHPEGIRGRRDALIGVAEIGIT